MIPNAQKLVETAYTKLKQMVHYERNHLLLRRRLAEFECANDFPQRLASIAHLINSDNIADSIDFLTWLDQIDFTLIPKGVVSRQRHAKDQGSYVTNVSSDSKYFVEKVNYIFDGPIELHLISVLWLMVEGREFDAALSAHCMGSRFHELLGDRDDCSGYLFKKYHEQYSKWRDNGISTAHHLLTKEKQSVCMLALDIQEYYYRIQVDWQQLRSQVDRSFPDKAVAMNFQQLEVLGGSLFDCVEAICRKYHDKITDFLKLTHSDLPIEATCLPIGLSASPVIANWYLKEFDDALISKIRPAYYARYIDDMFLVIASEVAPKGDDPIKDFMDCLLVESGVLKWDEDAERYELVVRPGLYLQKKKCILQYFDSEHSIAGLHKFKNEIEENASEFALLPLEGDDSPVAQVAYDILYDGSANKFRSVKAIAENRFELAQHLAKQTQLHLLTDGKLDGEMKLELFHFFKGANAIDYWDMWERVIAFFLVADSATTVEKFAKAVRAEIRRAQFKGASEVTTKLLVTLEEHLQLSLDLTLALTAQNDFTDSPSPNIWRNANLIRHHLVAVPLLNYTRYYGDLTVQVDDVGLDFDEAKVARSPRYVHFEECLSFYDSGCAAASDIDSIILANQLYTQFHGTEIEGVQSLLTPPTGLETK